MEVLRKSHISSSSAGAGVEVKGSLSPSKIHEWLHSITALIFTSVGAEGSRDRSVTTLLIADCVIPTLAAKLT